jgi:CRISPR-associated protein Cmr4
MATRPLLTRPYLLHALSPLHAGTGQAVDVIDLPIARQRATGLPFVPGSSVKGVLRDACPDDTTRAVVFGPETLNAGDHAGALVVSDARLLALPVRAFRGTFAWVTSPLLLALARRDLQALGSGKLPARDPVPPAPAGVEPGTVRGARVGAGSLNLHGNGEPATLYLEDLDLPAVADGPDGAASKWAEFLAEHVAGDQPELFTRRFAVVDDETMTFLWETATQVDARVQLTPARTVKPGALWWEESLPPETLLVGTLLATRGMKPGHALEPEAVLEAAVPAERSLQFGGKATVGRGRCRIVPLVE